jgi:hypothetical protein
MAWVRNPWWDGFWLLSGLPIGIVLILVCPPVPPGRIFALAAAIMILETGHNVSPVILAWSKPGLRSIVRREWGKHLVLPVVLLAGCLFLPWSIVFGVYFVWNGWHFGMQLFGVSCLYAKPRDQDARLRRALLIVGLFVAQYAAVVVVPPSPQIQLLIFGIVSFNHWLVDIGLSSQASGWRWGFIPLVLVIGVVWLVLRNGPLSVQVVPQIIAIRAGIGMIHFVYSARIWQLNDPQVRAAISTDLFRVAT